MIICTNKTGWDIRHLRVAREISDWSKDPKCKVGSIIINDSRDPVSYGYNGFPAKLDDSVVALNDDDTRRKLMIHSELNAIHRADKSRLTGATLYVWPFRPCPVCVTHIIGVGITRVVTTDYIPDHWADRFKETDYLLEMANVEFTIIPMQEFRNNSDLPYNPASPLD